MIGAGRGPAGKRSVVGRGVRAKQSRAERKGYGSVWRDFHLGDLRLFRGRGLPSQAIRLPTRSPYSHVGLVFPCQGRLFYLEAVGVGVRLNLMSEVMRRYHGGIDYCEVPSAALREHLPIETKPLDANASVELDDVNSVIHRPGLR